MNDEKLIGESTHIRCKTIIEVLGKPKEHVETTIRNYIDKIKDDSGLIVLSNTFSDAKEKENMWSVFSEMEIVIKGIHKLIAFCFDYMPSSIEIVKPEELSLKKSSIEDFVNDLQARLHDVDMIVKKQRNENIFLRRNMNAAITNTILITLATGDFDKDKLSRITGIPHEELKLILNHMINEKKIKESNGLYSIVKTKEGKNAQE